MRDSTHPDQIRRWAEYVRSHPKWKKVHTAFINAQYEKALETLARLAKTKDGKEKIRKIRMLRDTRKF